MRGHAVAEARSISLHAAVADRLRDDPELITQARARIEEWLQSGRIHPRYAAAWRDVLSSDLESICATLVDPSESAAALRQNTPFVGVLDAHTRWRILRAAGDRAAGEAPKR